MIKILCFPISLHWELNSLRLYIFSSIAVLMIHSLGATLVLRHAPWNKKFRSLVNIIPLRSKNCKYGTNNKEMIHAPDFHEVLAESA